MAASASPGKSRPDAARGMQDGKATQSRPQAQAHTKQTLSRHARDALPARPANGDHRQDQVDEDDDGDDRGEGTSADRTAIMARIAAAGTAGHLDIASLLKEPLVFVPAKHADEASKKLPYIPLTPDSATSAAQVSFDCPVATASLLRG